MAAPFKRVNPSVPATVTTPNPFKHGDQVIVNDEFFGNPSATVSDYFSDGNGSLKISVTFTSNGTLFTKTYNISQLTKASS